MNTEVLSTELDMLFPISCINILGYKKKFCALSYVFFFKFLFFFYWLINQKRILCKEYWFYWFISSN